VIKLFQYGFKYRLHSRLGSGLSLRIVLSKRNLAGCRAGGVFFELFSKVMEGNESSYV